MIRMNDAERQRAADFLQQLCNDPPLYFRLGDREARELADPARKTVTRTERADRTCVTVTQPLPGLTARVEAVLWKEHPALEWTVWLTAEADTAPVSHWRAFDGVLAPEMRSNHPGINHTFVLRHFKGDYYSPDGFEQFDTLLSNDIPLCFHNEGGRSCSTEFPYYRLCSDKREIAIAVSWQGQWETAFRFHWQQGVFFRTGQMYFDAALRPGETVRSPLVALLFSESPDDARCINLWRHWMLACNLPRNDGQIAPPQASFGSNARFYECMNATEENQLFFLNQLYENDVPFDVWWMDAMWYDCGSRCLPNWCPTGSWYADPTRFPRSLKPISDLLHAHGDKLMAWFEPERVAPGTEIYEKYPQFTLTTPQAETEEIQNGAMGTDTNASIDNSRLFNLADPQAAAWITDKIDRAVTDNGIDWYRQDMNTNPLRVWQANDEPGRTGMLENLYCQHLLTYWDELLRRHPGQWQDTCASGGRRIELETLRRAYPICKSDYNAIDPRVTAAFHSSLYQWVPYFGSHYITEAWPLNDYTLAVHLAEFTAHDFDLRNEQDYARIRRFLLARQELVPYLRGDYYPLLPYTRDPRQWMAFQFDRPERGDGLLIVLAHAGSLFRQAELPLRGIDPDASYRVQRMQDLAWSEAETVSGAALAKGLPVTLAGAPQVLLLRYEKQ